MNKKEKSLERAALEKVFEVEVGWGPEWRDDMIAASLFKFMCSAHDFVANDHVVLDVSAGQSPYKAFFAHANYVALDSTVGDKNWDYSKLDIVGDAMHLPIRAASIDVALNFVSLEHYPEPWNFFAEIARVLKPGGKLFLFVPFVYEEHQRPYDFYRFTEYALRDLCTRSGLAPEEVLPVCNLFFTATRVLDFCRASLERIGGAQFAEYLAQTQRHLKTMATQFAEHSAQKPELIDEVSILPMQYTLRAAKPGALVVEPAPADRTALLSRILADPFEKKPIVWDGHSSEVAATGSNRCYPVRNGIIHFMS